MPMDFNSLNEIQHNEAVRKRLPKGQQEWCSRHADQSKTCAAPQSGAKATNAFDILFAFALDVIE